MFVTMTARELCITPEEHSGLIAVMEKLRSGQYAYKAVQDVDDYDGSEGNIFNMAYGCVQAGCGTVGCIAGWLSREHLGKSREAADYYTYDNHPPQLKELYFPQSLEGGSWGDITPTQAAQAIENFLTTGCPRWEEVVA